MNATGQMLSALLGWSQATFASELAVEGDHALVTREVDGGLQTIKVKMPAIVTVDLRLNEPRYASLPNIMKAKKKPLDEKTAADYGVDVTPRLTVVSTAEPEARKAGVKVGSVDELIGNSRKRGRSDGCSSSCRSQQRRTVDGRHRQGRDRGCQAGRRDVLCRRRVGQAAAADEAATIDGVAKVLCAEDDSLGHRLAETVADLIVGWRAITATSWRPRRRTPRTSCRGSRRCWTSW
jgi:electron transfer flavoprotein alpha subunit